MRASGGDGPRTYTFLYTDIVGSSRLWEADPVVMAAALEAHNQLLEQAVSQHGGKVFKSLGDGLASVFESAHDAVACAVSIQRVVAAACLPGPIEIRIGVHSGTAHPVGADFGGPVLNRVSRITDLAEPGHIYVSEAAQSLSKDYLPEEITYVDLGEVLLEGMNRPERIYAATAEGLHLTAKPYATFELPASNLEPMEKPFIGRKSERADLAGRLRNPVQRLITVIGFGGIGKTTLARQCGLDVLSDFDGRVFWIECEAITSRDELASATLQVLGEVTDSDSAESAIVDIVQDACILLIFDCFERIVVLGGFLDRLVRRCPNLKILVTSRIVLGAEAEYLVELGGMSGKASAGIESDAVALLCSHAARFAPEFGKSKSDRTASRRLVRTLEFIPLAIVICAARLRYTPIDALNEQVRTSVLESVRSVRDQDGRHSGLGRVIEMSFDLLSPNDRRVLEALFVFEGSFTLACARSVLEPTLGDVEASVFRLRDHSLIHGIETVRFRLLDSVREFLSTTIKSEFKTEIEISHAVTYLAEARRIQSAYEAGDLHEATRMWRLESSNLRRAVEYGTRHQLGVAGFARALARILLEAGFYRQLQVLLTTALHAAREDGDYEHEAELLGVQGTVFRRSSQSQLAVMCFSERARLGERLANDHLYADSICDMAMTYLQVGDLDNAKLAIELVFGLGQRAGNLIVSAQAMGCLLAAKQGDASKAMEFGLKAEDLLPHNPDAVFAVAGTLGEAYRLIGEVHKSTAILIQMVRRALAQDYMTAAAYALIELAKSLALLDRGELAASALACAQKVPNGLTPSLQSKAKQVSAQIDEQPNHPLTRLAIQRLAGKPWATNVDSLLCSTEASKLDAH